MSEAYFWIFINPRFTTLQQKAEFLSFPYKRIDINNINSEIIHGTESNGAVLTILKIPCKDIYKELTLSIEINGYRKWNNDGNKDSEKYSPTKEVRIEIIINNKIEMVLNFSNLPKNYYSSDISYDNLKLNKDNYSLANTKFFKLNSSIEEIKIRLITNHSLKNDEKIFSEYFENRNYSIIICIGDPNFILFLNGLFFFLIWYLYIIYIILKRYYQNFICIYKNLKRDFHSELKNTNFKSSFKILKKIENKYKYFLKKYLISY